MVAVPSVGAGGVVAIPPLPYWHRPMKSLEALSGLALAIAMASLPVQPADNGQEFHTHKVLAGPFAAERFAKVVAVIIADTGGGIEPRSANHGAVRHARCGGSSGALRGTLSSVNSGRAWSIGSLCARSPIRAGACIVCVWGLCAQLAEVGCKR
jgi:hypothetical protein